MAHVNLPPYIKYNTNNNNNNFSNNKILVQ